MRQRLREILEQRTRVSGLGRLVIFVTSFLMFMGFTSAQTGSREALMFNDFFVHYWWGPPTTENLDEKYTAVARCGFTYAGIPGEGEAATPETSLAILDVCQRNGLKYLLCDSRVNPRLAGKRPEDPDFEPSLEAAITQYAQHPACGGFHIVDEPSASLFPWLARIHSYLRQKLPGKLLYINLLPNWAPAWLLEYPTPEAVPAGIKPEMTYEAYVDTFVQTVKPDLLSYDNYAFLEGIPERFDLYFANFELIRRKGLQYHLPTCFVLGSQGQPRPTAADLQWQVNMALVYGFKGISYYTYWVWGEQPLAITYLDCLPTEKYAEVRKINQQIRNLGPTLMRLTSTGVYHTMDIPHGCMPPPSDLPCSVQGEYPVVLGMFQHEDASTWAMVVNRENLHGNEVRLDFNVPVERVAELRPGTGALRPVRLESGGVVLNLRPAEGRLFRLGPSVD